MSKCVCCLRQETTGSNTGEQSPSESGQSGATTAGSKPAQKPADAAQKAQEQPDAVPSNSAISGANGDNNAESKDGGERSGLQKHWSEESAGGISCEEGEDEEEGTLDDIDEDDDGDGSSWQVSSF